MGIVAWLRFCWIYYIVNEKNCTIAEVWDGRDLKFTFRSTVDECLMGQWSDLLEIARSITFTDENDQPIWMYNPSGVYSVKSFYAIVNDPGIKRIHTPAIWNIIVPP